MANFKLLEIGAQSGKALIREPDSVGINIGWVRLHEVYDRKPDAILVLMDGRYLGFKDNSFERIYIGKVLHWLESRKDIEMMISEAIRVAEKSVRITVPNFGYNNLLAQQGLRFTWTTWRTHPPQVQQHCTEKGLIKIFKKLGLKNYKMEFLHPIEDSSGLHIVPKYVRDAGCFQEEIMDKPFVQFPKRLWTIIAVEIELNGI